MENHLKSALNKDTIDCFYLIKQYHLLSAKLHILIKLTDSFTIYYDDIVIIGRRKSLDLSKIPSC